MLKKISIIIVLLITLLTISCGSDKKHIKKEDQKKVETVYIPKYRDIFEAIKSKDLKAVKYFIEKKEISIDLRSKGEKKETILIYSIKNGNIDIVQYLLEKGANPNLVDIDGNGAVIYSIFKQDIDILKLLNEYKGNLAVINRNNNSTLMIASELGNIDIVIYLVNNKVPVNYKNKKGETALFFAARGGHVEVLKLLKEGGGSVYDKNSSNQTLLFYAKNSEVAKYLVFRGIDMEHQDKKGDTAIFPAAKNGNLEMVNYLHKRGISITHKNSENKTPFIYAIINKQFNIAKYLYQNGIDVDQVDYKGQSAIHFAKDLDTIKFLKSLGAIIEKPDLSGKDKIMYLIDENRLTEQILDYYIANGYNVNSYDNSEKYLITYLILNKKLSMVKKLIKNGAKTDIKDSKGRNLLHYARSVSDKRMVKYLKKFIKEGLFE